MAATYISTDVACSIIGDGRLDFQVRNGAGYDPPSSPTTKRDKDTDVCLSLFALESLSKLSIVKSQTFKGYLMHVVGSKLQS